MADRANTLRAALGDALGAGARPLYARWAAWERAQAARLHYAPDEPQLRNEWARLTAAAARPGAALHQLHVFALAHVLRRPLLVYGVDVVNSFRGEALGYARFRGLYLPLLCEPEGCCKSPLALGYTRGHFSALVPLRAPAYICRDARADCALLPLTDLDGKLLPVHFLTQDEVRACTPSPAPPTPRPPVLTRRVADVGRGGGGAALGVGVRDGWRRAGGAADAARAPAAAGADAGGVAQPLPPPRVRTAPTPTPPTCRPALTGSAVSAGSRRAARSRRGCRRRAPSTPATPTRTRSSADGPRAAGTECDVPPATL